MENKNAQLDSSYLTAKKRVKALKDFYTHAVVVCLVIPFLIFINYNTYWDYKWFWFPTAGLVISIIIHWFVLKVHNSGWEERKIQQLMEEESRFDN